MEKNEYILMLEKYQNLANDLNDILKSLSNTSTTIKMAFYDAESNNEEKQLIRIKDLFLSEYNKIIYNIIPEIEEKIKEFEYQAPVVNDPTPNVEPEKPSRPTPPPRRNQNISLN